MSLSGPRLTLVFLLLGGGIALAADNTFERSVAPFFSQHCTFCHNAKMTMAALNLEAYKTHQAAVEAGEVWDKVLAKLRAGEMPPPGRPKPSTDELKPVLGWLESETAARAKERGPEPGRVTARRLNRDEYNNTIRDLLGLDIKPANEFPVDDSGYGFDNIGDVLSISPVLMERYLAAAEKVAREAIVVERPLPVTNEIHRPESTAGPEGEAVWPAEFEVKHDFPVDAEYEITAAVTGRRPDASLFAKLVVWLDGQEVGVKEMIEGAKGRSVEKRFFIEAGTHELRAALIEDRPYVDDSLGEVSGPNTRENNLVPDRIEITGPFDQRPQPLSASHRRVFVCGERGRYDAACTDRILRNLTLRAFRRPPADSEVEKLHGLVKLAMNEGASWEEGIQVALQAVLVSPHFLFRIERDADPADPGEIHRLSDFELASRLSYFLWSSMPDDELLRLAELELLDKPEVVDAQVRRMLADEKSQALVKNFAGQWLQLRNLEQVKPDPEKFPEFDGALAAAMRRETELFFESVMREDGSIVDLIDGRYTYLNERLARHYGIEGVKGDHLRRVELDGEQRSGVLTQASIMTVSSYPTRTSPVLRGLWVLENFLGAPPPPPPPDVPGLDDSGVGITGTLRQQLEQHRANPACAVCHDRIDPLGFGLENYDPIGGWRTRDGKFPIDAAGTLPDGRSFTTPRELKEILKGNSEAFAECVTEKMMTYALGRGMEDFDKPLLKEISHKVAADGYRFSRLVGEIVRSLPFQMRRSEVRQKPGEKTT